jgi:hypothetical protein
MMTKTHFTVLLVSALLVLFSGCGQKTPPEMSMSDLIDDAMAKAIVKYKGLGAEMEQNPGRLPRTIDEHGQLITAKSAWWTSGFFPGSLWYLYEYSNDPDILRLAKTMTARVEDQKYTTNNHDVGFMIYCSFGNGLRLTGEESYNEVILTGAHSLSTRFNENIGLIQSWGTNEKWQYPVIIDNMMNLELLCWATKHSGDPRFMEIARIHADNTIKSHFREDYSTVHVVSYDTATAEVEKKQTHQGYSDESAWARGQAWGFYGYVMMYRETKEQRYLDQAINIAEFLVNHPNLPEDMIPYWDFDAPNIPDEERDASAGAIMASALIELSQYVDAEKAKDYADIGEQQIRSLASDAYFSEAGTNGNFILMHSVGSKPGNSEVDVPLTYADYYFLEAMLRYKKFFLN